jgi:hypothetical protein
MTPDLDEGNPPALNQSANHALIYGQDLSRLLDRQKPVHASGHCGGGHFNLPAEAKM